MTGLERVIVDDVRFENEVAAVRTLGGTVIEVRWPGLARLPGAPALAGRHARLGVDVGRYSLIAVDLH